MGNLTRNWSSINAKVRRRLWIGLPFYPLLFLLLARFVGFGEWPGGWLFLGYSFVSSYSAFFFLVAKNPEVISARAARHQGTKGWDKVLLAFFAVILLAHLAVAVLDGGVFRWSRMASWWAAPGFVLVVSGHCLSVWAAGVNKFFEPTVRIQEDRNHEVVTDGPYRYVRHPGYSGVILWCLGSPFILGSWACFVTGSLAAALLVTRTVLEDGTLQLELAGYSSYCEKVPSRLLPGLW